MSTCTVIQTMLKGRQTDRQTETETHRDRETETEREKKKAEMPESDRGL